MKHKLLKEIRDAWNNKHFGGSFCKTSLHPNDVYSVTEIGFTLAEDALVFRFPGSLFDIIKAEDIVESKYEVGSDQVKHWFIRAYSENYHIRIL